MLLYPIYPPVKAIQASLSDLGQLTVARCRVGLIRVRELLQAMKIYVNVMEMLIEQEIVNRLQETSDEHLKREVVSLMAYALNRVPPLYACSIQGVQRQIKRAKNDYQSHIENAVRWSFSAVKQAPRTPPVGLSREVYQQILSETRKARKTHELSPIDLPELIDSMVPEDESEPTQGQPSEDLAA